MTNGFGTMTPEIALAANYYRWLFSTIRPYLGSRILEIGVGYGTIIDLLIGDNRSYMGIDIDSDIISRMQEKYQGRQQVSFLRADLSEQSSLSDVLRYAPDTLLSINVLEHMSDPLPYLKNLRQIVRGNAVVMVPAFPVLFGSLDEQAGHHRRYGKNELCGLLRESGFRVNRVFYFNAFGTMTWFLTSRVLRQKINSRSTGRLVLMNDCFILPAVRWMDTFFNRIAGQSLIAVCGASS